MLSNLDETFLNEFNSSELDSIIFQSSIQTHFALTNSNDWILAYSLIKNCVIQIEQINTK